MENVTQPPGATEPQRPGRHRLTYAGSVVAVDDPRDSLINPRHPDYVKEPPLQWPGEVRISPYDESTLLRFIESEGASRLWRPLLALYQRGLIEGRRERGAITEAAYARAVATLPDWDTDRQLDAVIAEFTREVLEWGRKYPEEPARQ